MPYFAGSARPIHFRRFIHIRVHACNRCQIDNRIPPDGLPDVTAEHDLVEIMGFHHVEDAAVAAEETDDLIQ